MKICFYFFLISIFANTAFSQNTDETINKNGNSVAMTINNKTLDFEIDEQGQEIVMSFKELEMIVKKQILLYKPNLKKDTALVNGKKQVTLSLNLDTVRFNCLLLTNVPAKVIYTIPNYDPKAKAILGLGLLKKYGNVTNGSQAIAIKNINKQYIDPKCLGTPNPSQNPTPPCAYFSEVRFVPCSSDPSLLQKKANLQANIMSNQGCNTYTEESNIPQQKAIDRVQNGITIRYFDDNDLDAVQKMETTIKTLFAGEAVYLENMRPYYKSSMPKYIELWLK